MSYAQKKELSGNKTMAIVIAVALQLSLGYALITGLAFNVIKKEVQNLKTFNVEQPPPPKEKPPPPPKEIPKVPPPPVTPPSIVTPPVTPPPQIYQQVTNTLPPPAPIRPPAPPPAPPAPVKTQSAQPANGDVRQLFVGVDYPEAAIESNASGTAKAQLTISPDGRVSSCSLIEATGNSSLDSFTCQILRRARFTPARDSSGNPTTGSYTTPPIRFELKGD